MELNGKVALVTGGTKGIGYYTAIAILGQGILTDIKKSNLII